eukprot:1357896-Amorphochlora_amoeboformis.AAC.1
MGKVWFWRDRICSGDEHVRIFVYHSQHTCSHECRKSRILETSTFVGFVGLQSSMYTFTRSAYMFSQFINPGPRHHKKFSFDPFREEKRKKNIVCVHAYWLLCPEVRANEGVWNGYHAKERAPKSIAARRHYWCVGTGAGQSRKYLQICLRDISECLPNYT